VRHGESRFNVPSQNGARYVQGKNIAVPLTEKGKDQVGSLARHLIKKLPFPEQIVICSSAAKRASETANILFEGLREHCCCELSGCFENLCELNQGAWEGMLQDAHYHNELNKWERLSAALKYLTPRLEGGESFKELVDRALPELQNLVSKHRHKIIIALTHYVAMNALTLHWSRAFLTLSDDQGSKLPQVKFNNCDILLLELRQDDAIDQAKILMHIKTEE
ncbi:MAG: histidine phosphatase family protein, partial [Parachlamydia sp.]|nr:histidine phosphatase family protein [Parachlamydia sp.]